MRMRRSTTAIMVGDIRVGQGETTLSPSAPTPTPTESSAIVSGAGTSAANGEYLEDGTAFGKPKYALDGGNPLTQIIWWTSLIWSIDGIDGNLYASAEDTAFPWLVVSWTPIDGEAPAPTVTEG